MPWHDWIGFPGQAGTGFTARPSVWRRSSRATAKRAAYRRGAGYVGRASYKGKKLWKKGFDRTAGYYGRYNQGRFQKSSGRELKFHDIEVASGTSLPATPGGNNLCVIGQGTGESERIGRKCTIKQINVNAVLTLPVTAAEGQAHDYGVLYLVLDKQANGASPAAADIWENPSDPEVNFLNLANSRRFVILWKRAVTLYSTAAAWDGTTDKYASRDRLIQCRLKCNIPIVYNGVTGGVTETESNNIVFYYGSRHANLTMHARVRLRFTG